jgi:hypothetical protein
MTSLNKAGFALAVLLQCRKLPLEVVTKFSRNREEYAMSVQSSFNPSGPITVDPQTITFGSLAPGQKGDASKDVVHPAVDAARVTAQIIAGAPFFTVDSLTVFDVVEVTADPSEVPKNHKGPLPKGKVLEIVGQSNGTTPVAVGSGQSLTVEVSATPPDGFIPLDTVLGTVLIQGDTWNPIHIPLAAFVAHVNTELLAAPTIQQGQQADLPIKLQWLAGPDTDVQYTLNADPASQGITMLPMTLHLNRAGTVSGNLHFTAAPDAPVGMHSLAVFESAFNGQDVTEIYPDLNVVHGPVAVSLTTPDALVTEQGASFLSEVLVALSGESTAVSLTPGTMPAGVSFAPQTVTVGIGGSAFVGLQFTVDAHAFATAPPVPSQATIHWSAYNGEQTGTLTLSLTIQLVTKTFSSGPFDSGNVRCNSARVSCRSDGLWFFSGSLHDSSNVFGDNYAIGFAFDFHQNGQGVGTILTGELGGGATSPSQDVSFQAGNHGEPFIINNWPDIFANNVAFSLRVSGDFAQLISDVGDDFKNLFGSLSVTTDLEGESDPQDPDPGGSTEGD